MILLLITIFGLGSILISYLATSTLYKIVFLAIGIFIFGTVGLKYVYFLTMQTMNNCKGKKSSNNKEDNKKQYPKKIVNNNDYDELVKCIKYLMSNRLMDREQILDFKSKVCKQLGKCNSHYKDFKWENDLQEIYTKIKNKHLKSEDYQELLSILGNYKAN